MIASNQYETEDNNSDGSIRSGSSRRRRRQQERKEAAARRQQQHIEALRQKKEEDDRLTARMDEDQRLWEQQQRKQRRRSADAADAADDDDSVDLVKGSDGHFYFVESPTATRKKQPATTAIPPEDESESSLSDIESDSDCSDAEEDAFLASMTSLLSLSQSYSGHAPSNPFATMTSDLNRSTATIAVVEDDATASDGEYETYVTDLQPEPVDPYDD